MNKYLLPSAIGVLVLTAVTSAGIAYVLTDAPDESRTKDTKSRKSKSAVVLGENQIQVNADGSFTPDHLIVDAGETVEWLLPSKFDAIVEAQDPTGLAEGSCPSSVPVALSDQNAFTGPFIQHASGIFTMNLRGPGFVEEKVGPDNRCSNGEVNPYAVGGETLCKVGELNASMEQTWADPTIAGVFVRSDWRDLQTGPGMDDANFDFSALDRELDAAVAHGKLVTLNVVAGGKGTPDWLFTEGGVQPLYFEDKTAEGGGTEEEKNDCGVRMTLGDPTDDAYQTQYFNMIRKLGEHIRTRSDWYRAVAYVKLSGANQLTEELDLPSSCTEGCICNTQVWAKAGYTPSGLQEFFARQMDVWQEEFPGRPMIYALIQDGWPRVSEDGAYLSVGKQTVGGKVPGPYDQTEALLDMGWEMYGDLFVTSHNGLQPIDEGRPNPWVLEAQAEGRPTSYQTTNLKKVADEEDLQGALALLWEQTNAFYLEIYEQVAWDARERDGVLVAAGQAETNTMAEWDAALESRRNESTFGSVPVYPLTYDFAFASPGTFTFYNPSTCAEGTAEKKYGVIEVR